MVFSPPRSATPITADPLGDRNAQGDHADARPIGAALPVASQVSAPFAPLGMKAALSPAADEAPAQIPAPPLPVEPAPERVNARVAAARIEAETTSRPVLAPREALVGRSAPTSQPRAQIGVVVAAEKGLPAEFLVAAEGNVMTAYSAAKAAARDATVATPAGVHLIESPAGSPIGRLCNVGYRHLKKLNPELRFVQFLENQARLDPQWIDAALKFMERRPEVAVIEGRQEALIPAGLAPPSGEVQAVGRTFLVRAEAFEGVGGFRGDLFVNETADLCIRLRRRGAHVWRVDDLMCTTPGGDRRAWWRDAVDAGYAYAHGVRLYGGDPERLFLREHARSLAWGAAVPVCVGALGFGAGAFLALSGAVVQGVVAIAAVALFGAALYAARIAVIAIRGGAAKRASWSYATRVIIGQFGEFIGACRFYFSGTDPRRSAP